MAGQLLLFPDLHSVPPTQSFCSFGFSEAISKCVFFGSCPLSHFHTLTLPETLIILHFHGFHYHVVTDSSCSEHYYFYLLGKSSVGVGFSHPKCSFGIWALSDLIRKR